MTRRRARTGCFLVLAAVVGAAGSRAEQIGVPQQTARDQGVLEQIVVRVNGDPITKTDIDERVRVTRALAPKDAAVSGAADAIDLLPRILSDAIDELLMMQRAAELGLGVTEDDVDRVVATVRADSHATTDEAFDAILQSEGIALPALRASVKRQLLIERVRQHVFRRVSVGDEEARREFDRQNTGATRDRLVTFRELCVRVPAHGQVDDKERDRALVRLVAAGDKLGAGADFADVARTYSDAPSKSSGGTVGPVGVTGLDPAVRSALSGLRPGRVSRPVATAEGYCFLKLEKDVPGGVRSYREHRDAIIERLLAEKQRAALEDLLKRLRAAAILQWKRGDMRAMYERGFAYR
jgi:parvulin-like peptidyl-prolyl isomerase